MPVTITAGITFSGGGLTMAFAPPSTYTAGWFGGGVVSFNGPLTSTITRITYATDTASSTNRGTLSIAKSRFGSTGTSTQGWWAGGYLNPGSSSAVDRTTYATDTATASVRGPLTSARYYIAATTDGSTYGWFAGGSGPGGATVDRITYATDTAAAGSRGPLSVANNNGFAASGTTTDGWFGGGGVPGGSGYISTVQRITYATDTATASVKGPLSLARAENLSATGDNTTYGWFGGGYSPGINRVSLIDRITFATDTATASVRGPMSVQRATLAASTDNSTYGWFTAGMAYPYNLPNYSITTVDRITYATDTVTASVRGGLNQPVLSHGGTSGIQ